MKVISRTKAGPTISAKRRMPPESVAHAELGGGQAKHGRLRANPQIAAQCERETAAHAKPLNLRDGRLRTGAQQVGGGSSGFVVALRVLHGSTFGSELGNVRTGHKRLAPGSGKHNHANFRIVNEILKHLLGGLPHRQRHGVAAFRIIENDAPDALVFLGENFVGVWSHETSSSCVLKDS